MVETQWLDLTTRFRKIRLHEYVVMPNHFHAILEITEPVRVTLVVAPTGETGSTLESESDDPESLLGRPQGIAPTGIGSTASNKTVGDIIGAFKSIVTVEYIRGVKSLGWPAFRKRLLQRDYYEHIIRNEGEYKRISDYIVDNPVKWQADKFHGK